MSETLKQVLARQRLEREQSMAKQKEHEKTRERTPWEKEQPVELPPEEPIEDDFSAFYKPRPDLRPEIPTEDTLVTLEEDWFDGKISGEELKKRTAELKAKEG
jgi:hypothetical protein